MLVMLFSHGVVCHKKAEQQQRIQSPKVKNAAAYHKQLNCSKRMLVKQCMTAHGDCEKRSSTKSPLSHRK